MTTTPTVDDRHSALALPDLWDAVDTAFASRHLHDVCVTGTVIKLTPGRWYTYGELAAFGDDGQAAASLGFSIHHTLMAGIRSELAATGAALAEGVELRVSGILESDRRYGRLRLAVQTVDPRIGRSAHAAERQRLLDELHRTGLLTRQQRLTVADVPQRIGLISSHTSAGHADFWHTLRNGGYQGLIIEDDVPMSGPRTPELVVASLQRLHHHNDVDVIVIARGGGARADLSTWDHPAIAHAIATCATPVWTALGHTTDTTIADQVANRHFPTPTSVAEAFVAAHTHRARNRDEAAREAAAELEALQAIAAQRRRTRIAVAAAVVLAIAVAILVTVLVGVT